MSHLNVQNDFTLQEKEKRRRKEKEAIGNIGNIGNVSIKQKEYGLSVNVTSRVYSCGIETCLPVK